MKSTFVHAVMLMVTTSIMASSLPEPASVYINPSERRQTIEGFGGGMVFHVYPYNHPEKAALYDSIFNVAKVNVLRVGNWYDPEKGEEVKEVPMLLEIQQKWPQVKTMLTSWSPPAYLKSNNSLLGANRPTLKKNSDSVYMYKEYAEYWYKSIKYFKSKGVRIDWVSIQNEPDWSPAYEGCVLEAVETDSVASYGKALNAVFTKCNVENNERVRFLGPDVPGVGDNRMTRFVESNEMQKNQIVAYAHHYYDYSGTNWMELTRSLYTDKPIYQTEFLVNEGKDWTGMDRTWFDHALIINQMLTYEGVSMYCLFSLAYKPASTHCFFSLDTLGGAWYQERPTYAMFKQYSRSIHRGWQRILAQCMDPEVVVSAFVNTTADSLAIVLVNSAGTPKNITFDYEGYSGTATQTTDSVKYSRIKTLQSKDTLTLPVRSITTFDLTRSPVAAYQSVKNRMNDAPPLFTLRTGPDGTLKVVAAAGVSGPVGFAVHNLAGKLVASTTGLASGQDKSMLTLNSAVKMARGTSVVTIRYAGVFYNTCVVSKQ